MVEVGQYWKCDLSEGYVIWEILEIDDDDVKEIIIETSNYDYQMGRESYEPTTNYPPYDSSYELVPYYNTPLWKVLNGS